MLRPGNARLTRLALGIFVALQLSACGLTRGVGETGPFGIEMTYQKFLMRAEGGDAESQNVVGFMLFHGEGVPVDGVRAEMWFRRAAAQGNVRAQRNLAIMSSLGAEGFGPIQERQPVNESTQTLQPGERVYLRFCSGCHGFNGIAAYVHSPSFALGQTLEKGDAELMRSLLHGKGEMPNWDDKLSRGELEDVLRFVRTLRLRYDAGISQPLRAAPSFYYLFGPMKSRESSFRGYNW